MCARSAANPTSIFRLCFAAISPPKILCKSVSSNECDTAKIKRRAAEERAFSFQRLWYSVRGTPSSCTECTFGAKNSPVVYGVIIFHFTFLAFLSKT